MNSNKDLNLRSVTDLVTLGIKSYSDLDLPPKELDSKYIEFVKKSLEKCQLVEQEGLYGGYLRVFKPVIEGTTVETAIKVILPFENYEIDEIIGRHSILDLENCWKTSPNVYIIGRDRSSSFNDLCYKEKMLVVLAYEHELHQNLYHDFVLPSVFLTFRPLIDVLSKQPVTDEEYTDILKAENRLSEDNREILINKGKIECAMIQNFEQLSDSVFLLNPNSMTTEQLDQLDEFANNLEDVYAKTGYRPDERMSHVMGNNLKFSGNKLILIDSNHIRRDKVHSGNLLVVKRIREMVKKGRNKSQ